VQVSPSTPHEPTFPKSSLSAIEYEGHNLPVNVTEFKSMHPP
jgi:hypothetical protein